MTKGRVLLCVLASGLVCIPALWLAAQESGVDTATGGDSTSVIHKVVDMVQLNIAVTDGSGKYVSGLRPEDFQITEDGIDEKVATFEEGNEAPEVVSDATKGSKAGTSQVTLQPSPQTIAKAMKNGAPAGPNAGSDAPPAPGDLLTASAGESAGMLGLDAESALIGSNVFILFDTSNYMYRGFVFAQDAIADFVRSLDGSDRVAVYSYSHDFFRASLITSDRSQVLRGVRQTVVGDDCALYNALLLTLKDAAKLNGKKVVVVFSNGPDDASMVPPEDVDELAQSEGVPIYMISTREAKQDPLSTAVFGRISSRSGGEAFFAKSWKDQREAFASIREDLEHLYALSYYPQQNPNRGWRSIKVKLVGERFKKYHIRTRNGYRPEPFRGSGEEDLNFAQ